MPYKIKNDPRGKISRKKWYYANKKRQIKNQLKRRKYLIALLERYKRFLRCIDCNMSFRDRPECCDFHHLDPKKKRDGIRVLITYSLKSFKEELKKCVPLCANCHRTRHKKTGLV